MMNEIIILLSKENKLWVTGCSKSEFNPVPIRLISLLAECGYLLSPDFKGLISPADEDRLLDTLVPWLKERHGLGRRWKTVWKTPAELLESEEGQKEIQGALYMCPKILDELHRSKKDVPEFWKTNNWKPTKVLTPGHDYDLSALCYNLLSSPLPLGYSDKEILRFLLDSRIDLIKLPSRIPVKENQAMILSYGLGKEMISGVNDILRVAAYLSNGDTTLEKKTRIHLSRANRKKVLSLLEGYLPVRPEDHYHWYLGDAKKYQALWKILGYQCHPNPKTYPATFNFLKGIRGVVRSWGSYLQAAYDEKRFDRVLLNLTQRPGEFIRRYDSLLRRAWKEQDIEFLDNLQSNFMEIKDASGKVLFELYKYYDRRNEDTERSFLDKRGIRHIYPSLSALPKELIDIAQTNVFQTIRGGWKKKNTFDGKKVYLNLPDNLTFSLSFRSGVIDQTEPMYPGQIIEFPTSGMIRFFSQWYDQIGDQDLDLHAWLINDKGELRPISWNTHFVDSEQFVSHSGDIRHQQGDCAEYVTIDYSKTFSYTWMLVTVQNYDGFQLKDVENWIGVSQISGEKDQQKKWIPTEESTLFRGKVTSEARDMSAFIVNLKEGWARLLLEGVEGDVLGNSKLIKQYLTPSTLQVKDLLSMYIQDTGGELVETGDKADTIISEEDYMSGRIHEYLLG